METITSKHKQTIYLVEDEKGKLTTIQYAPTMGYSGRKDSDQYALMLGLFIDELNHDLGLGEVKCHRNTGAAHGIHTVKDLTCKIVAKKTFVWDMDKPMGQRESDVQETSNFTQLINELRTKKS